MEDQKERSSSGLAHSPCLLSPRRATAQHVYSTTTPLTGNGLLPPYPYHHATMTGGRQDDHDDAPQGAAVQGRDALPASLTWLSGFYELTSQAVPGPKQRHEVDHASQSEEEEEEEEEADAEAAAPEGTEPVYVGGCCQYTVQDPAVRPGPQQVDKEMERIDWLVGPPPSSPLRAGDPTPSDCVARIPTPGVFDMVWLPPDCRRALDVVLPLPKKQHDTDHGRPPTVLAACTDGSVHVWDVVGPARSAAGGRSAVSSWRLPDVCPTMLTSCTPVLLPFIPAEEGEMGGPGEDRRALQLLCTSHQGGCALHDPISRETLRLAPHEYDAWCSAAFDVPTEEAEDISDAEPRRDEEEDCSPRRMMIATGGDDGVVKFYTRHRRRETCPADAASAKPQTETIEKMMIREGEGEGGAPAGSIEQQRRLHRQYNAAHEWRCERRFTVEAGVVSIAPVQRLRGGDGGSVYDIPLRKLYQLPPPGAEVNKDEGRWRPSTIPCTTSRRNSTRRSRGGADRSSQISLCSSTPYVLIGSYDESLTLLDVRRLPSSISSVHRWGEEVDVCGGGSGGGLGWGGGRVRRAAETAVVAQKKNLGGGVWRVQRTLFPFAEVAFSSNSSSSSGDGGGVMAPGWVSDRNILVLPLMQGGAGLLRYDVLAPASEVFGSALTPLNPTESEGEPLIYDTVVLGMQWTERAGVDLVDVVVGRTSFYQKQVQLFRVGPFNAAWSLNEAQLNRIRVNELTVQFGLSRPYSSLQKQTLISKGGGEKEETYRSIASLIVQMATDSEINAAVVADETAYAGLEATVVQNLLPEQTHPVRHPGTVEKAALRDAVDLPPSVSGQVHLLKIYREVDRPPPMGEGLWARLRALLGLGGPQVSPLIWEREYPAGAAGPPLQQRRRRPGLPLVTAEPLAAAQVAGLPSTVQEQRAEALRLEDMLHRALDRMEKTRQLYLSPEPLQRLQCERELGALQKCYEKANARSSAKKLAFKREEAAKAQAAMQSTTTEVVFAREGSAGTAETPASAPVVGLHPWWLDAPIVALDALDCGPAVDALSQCSRKVLEAYTKLDGPGAAGSEGGLQPQSPAPSPTSTME
eukprot:gene1391-814_t